MHEFVRVLRLSQAEQDVRLYRNYPDNYTEEMIEKDMKKFDSIIVNLALYDYNSFCTDSIERVR